MRGGGDLRSKYNRLHLTKVMRENKNKAERFYPFRLVGFISQNHTGCDSYRRECYRLNGRCRIEFLIFSIQVF